MKNIYITFFSILVLVLSTVSCRKEGDYFRNPNDHLSTLIPDSKSYHVNIFENVWSAINTGYAFWDITDVDWDQRYMEYKPKFEEIDSTIYNYTSTEEYIKDLQELYDGLTSGLKDGHMLVRAGTLVMEGTKQRYVSSSPSSEYNKSRMHDDYDAKVFRSTFLTELAVNENVTGFDSCYFLYAENQHAGHASCVYELSDGRKVPYLWNSDFVDTTTVRTFILTGKDSASVANARKWQPIYNGFIDNLTNTSKSELGGVILDLRTNGGGALNSLPNYINIFAGEEHTYWETRYKEGMGRYDMSAWVPFEIGMPDRYRDCASEDIPIVVLCDVNSVSCAEITTGSIKQMPTAHIIGERTWGGHGPLLGYDYSMFNLTYGGVSGDVNLSNGFFVFTSNFANRPAGGQILEGIGITPDEEVLYKDAGYQGQFDAAIKYLESLK